MRRTPALTLNSTTALLSGPCLQALHYATWYNCVVHIPERRPRARRLAYDNRVETTAATCANPRRFHPNVPLSACAASNLCFHCRRQPVKEYELIRKKAERELWGDTPPQSAGQWRRGNAPGTPGVNAARARRPSSMSASSPQGPDAATCPPRHECSTPQAASSAFSTPASRQRR